MSAHNENIRPQFSQIIADFEKDLDFSTARERKTRLFAYAYRRRLCAVYGGLALLGSGALIGLVQQRLAEDHTQAQHDLRYYALQQVAEDAGFVPDLPMRLTPVSSQLQFTEHLNTCALTVETTEVDSIQPVGSNHLRVKYVVSNPTAGQPAVTIDNFSELLHQPAFAVCKPQG
ncbi:MAG: hypothetical protein QFB87_04110 [Patescibacteria group bacterium]|nr:hypothetical protein [Patescibacteria group bacterium]